VLTGDLGEYGVGMKPDRLTDAVAQAVNHPF
jgi:hypothetical protein